ncbi:MAG: hypothetical protein AAGI90_00620 [Chlamydiota bacterium]
MIALGSNQNHHSLSDQEMIESFNAYKCIKRVKQLKDCLHASVLTGIIAMSVRASSTSKPTKVLCGVIAVISFLAAAYFTHQEPIYTSREMQAMKAKAARLPRWR